MTFCYFDVFGLAWKKEGIAEWAVEAIKANIDGRVDGVGSDGKERSVHPIVKTTGQCGKSRGRRRAVSTDRRPVVDGEGFPKKGSLLRNGGQDEKEAKLPARRRGLAAAYVSGSACRDYDTMVHEAQVLRSVQHRRIGNHLQIDESGSAHQSGQFFRTVEADTVVSVPDQPP
jgi:hypothetical protein